MKFRLVFRLSKWADFFLKILRDNIFKEKKSSFTFIKKKGGFQKIFPASYK